MSHPEPALARGGVLAAMALALLAAAMPASAQQTRLEDLRPSGPLTITADTAEWNDGGPMRYRGNVGLASDTLKLRGDTLELVQRAGGQFDARIGGAPAQLDHAPQPGATGPAARPVTARARQLAYDSATSIVELSGSAELTRGTDRITGERIRYDVRARRIQAEGGGTGGQVRIVIQPPAGNQESQP